MQFNSFEHQLDEKEEEEEAKEYSKLLPFKRGFFVILTDQILSTKVLSLLA